MIIWPALALALMAGQRAPALQSVAPSQQPAEVVNAIQVQGNLVTSDDEVRRIAEVRVGMAVEATTVDEVTARLRATRRFAHVEVLKRFASIADPSQIVLVIVVNEGAVRIEMTGDADRPTRVVRSHRPNVLFLPILDAEDGYGLTYGGQFAVPEPVGKGIRLSFPLTWGGDKRAAVELDRTIARGPIERLVAGASISRRTNPYFQEDDDRRQISLRAERHLVPALRLGATAGWQQVSFAGRDDHFTQSGADVVLDTRLDPVLARNAVYAKAAWEHLTFSSGGLNQTELDGRGYLGLLGQSILAVRALRADADQPLPPYLQPLLGGMANLRGFSAGTAVGDTLVAISAELILPLTSPLNIGKMGVSAFTDSGTVYNRGERLADQTMKVGYGGSVWFSAAFLRLNLAVAHGRGASTRVHIGGTVSF